GIRDRNVTGVQTCALPISLPVWPAMRMVCLQAHRGPDGEGYVLLDAQGREQPVALKGRLTDALGASPRRYTIALGHRRLAIVDRSEERRVGEEGSARWAQG